MPMSERVRRTVGKRWRKQESRKAFTFMPLIISDVYKQANIHDKEKRNAAKCLLGKQCGGLSVVY